MTVFLDDGRSLAGTIQGRDAVRDLAIVKIEAPGLKALKLADSSRVRLGSRAVVLGYPLDVTQLTVTTGIVSRFEFDSHSDVNWIQTDSAVNSGNSGGPLLNLQGQVIGVITAKIYTAGVEGFGLAVSTDTVKQYLEPLKDGAVTVSPGGTQRLGYTVPQGL